jgi:excisionase family DNA binding protein
MRARESASLRLSRAAVRTCCSRFSRRSRSGRRREHEKPVWRRPIRHGRRRVLRAGDDMTYDVLDIYSRLVVVFVRRALRRRRYRHILAPCDANPASCNNQPRGPRPRARSSTRSHQGPGRQSLLPMTREFLTVPEVADLLRTTRHAIYLQIGRGLLPGVIRIGRRILIKRQDLVSWLDSNRSPSPAR